MSLAQKYMTVALKTIENFSPERSGSFDPNRSNSFEAAYPSNYGGGNPHRSSIAHNRFSAHEDDSLFINQHSDSKLQNPLRSHVKRESVDRLRTGSTLIPDQSPPRSNFLQSIDHSIQDQNSFRSPYQPQRGGPYLQNEVTTSAYGKYAYNREPQRLMPYPNYKPQNVVPRESLKSFNQSRNQSQVFSPQRERDGHNWIQNQLNQVSMYDSEDRQSEFDSEKFEQERQKDWSNLNRSIEMSQNMIENLGKHNKDTTLKEIRNVDNRRASKTQDKVVASKVSSSRPSEMNPTYRTDSSFVNEITQEIKKTYDQNLKDLKSKLQQSLKKRKGGDRSHSVSKVVTKESPEKRANQVYDLIEKFVIDKESSYERETPHERSTVSHHRDHRDQKDHRDHKDYRKHKERSQDKESSYERETPHERSTVSHHRDHREHRDHKDHNHHHKHKERSKSRHNIKESEEQKTHKSSHHHHHQHTKPHHKVRTQSVGRVHHHDEIASSSHHSHHRSHKEGRRSSQSRTSYNPSRDSVVSELSHGREDSIIRHIKGHKEVHSGFMKNLDNFLMEKLIQRLDNDKKLSSNPYYQLYKDMLVEKHQIHPSITVTNRTPERLVLILLHVCIV